MQVLAKILSYYFIQVDAKYHANIDDCEGVQKRVLQSEHQVYIGIRVRKEDSQI